MSRLPGIRELFPEHLNSHLYGKEWVQVDTCHCRNCVPQPKRRSASPEAFISKFLDGPQATSNSMDEDTALRLDDIQESLQRQESRCSPSQSQEPFAPVGRHEDLNVTRSTSVSLCTELERRRHSFEQTFWISDVVDRPRQQTRSHTGLNEESASGLSREKSPSSPSNSYKNQHYHSDVKSYSLPMPAKLEMWDEARRHTCSICHKKFNRPSSLRIHETTHTGAKPFRCDWPQCGRLFNVNSNMRRHYRNHIALANGLPRARSRPGGRSTRRRREAYSTHREDHDVSLHSAPYSPSVGEKEEEEPYSPRSLHRSGSSYHEARSLSSNILPPQLRRSGTGVKADDFSDLELSD